MKFDHYIIDQAARHARNKYPEEACGFIIDDMFYPMNNIAKDKVNNFEIDSKYFMMYESRIKAVVHSHANYGHLSKIDMELQIKSGVPWIMINLINGALDLVAYWGDQIEPAELIGRRFCHGCWDCYSLVRDYYRLEKGIILNPYPRDDEWWLKEPSMLEDNCLNEGFEFIEESEAKEGDVVFMKIVAPVVNHSGILLNNGLILHHLYNRLSRKEPIGPWRGNISGYLRYKND